MILESSLVQQLHFTSTSECLFVYIYYLHVYFYYPVHIYYHLLCMYTFTILYIIYYPGDPICF